MAALTGNAINTSYQGLLKTTDNGALSATEKALTDGLGNNSTLTIGTASASFTGTLDLSGATVTGLPVDPNTTYDLASAQDGTNVDITLTGSDATVDTIQLTAGTNITLTEAAGSITIDAAGGGGAAGLVSGTDADSMKSAAALTTNPAVTLGEADIVLGENSTVTYTSATNNYYDGGAVVLGRNANLNKDVDFDFAPSKGGVVIGQEAEAKIDGLGCPVAIGSFARAGDARAVAISTGYSTGTKADANADGAISIGYQVVANGGYAIAIGASADALGYGSVALGNSSQSTVGGFQQGSVAIGSYAEAKANNTVAIGADSQAATDNTTVVGAQSEVISGAANQIITIGYENNIQGANNRIVHVGNGKTLPATNSANDTVMIGNSLELGSSTADVSNSVQIGLLSKLGSSNTVAIGRQAEAREEGGCAVGRNSLASGQNSFAGPNSTAAQARSAAFNGVTSVNADHTAVANLEVIGSGNGIKLTSPNGTVYTVTVSDAGALVVA